MPIRVRVHEQTAFRSWVTGFVLQTVGCSVEGTIELIWGGATETGVPAIVIPEVERESNTAEAALRLLRQAADDVPLYRMVNGNAVFAEDVLSLVGLVLGRSDEHGPVACDRHGRFLEATGWSVRAQVHEIAIVDRIVRQIRDALVSISAHSPSISVLEDTPWPNGARFAVAISHDIDNATRRSVAESTRKVLGASAAILSRDFAAVRRRMTEAVGLLRGGSLSPYWLMGSLAILEDARGVRSAFYVLPHESKIVREGGQRVRRYDFRDPEFGTLIEQLAHDGWEIGLHTTYDGATTSHGVKVELARLTRRFPGIPVTGGRNHYLRGSIPELWRAASQAGLKYDASLGSSKGWGFRCGTSWPYPAFDLATHEELPIWELGLHLMDVALPSADEALTALDSLLTEVAALGGCASVLIHPSPAYGLSPRSFLGFYETLLDAICSHARVWVAPPSAVVAAALAHRMRATAAADT